MNFTDETLMSYVDGEADADACTAIEAAARQDPHLAQRIEQQRQLRTRLATAFGSVLSEAVPERLTHSALTSPASARVLGTERDWFGAARRRTRGWSWPEWGAVAASLCIGILASRMFVGGASAPLTTADGRLLARGELAAGLSELSGSTTNAAGNVGVGMTYRDKSGSYCRTFNMQGNAALAGIACRQGTQWRVQALLENDQPATQSQYRMAGSELPPVLLGVVEAAIEGDPLDVEGEAAARARGWRP